VRVDSQRLPGKALLRESGQELFLHTADQARRAGNIDAVYIATDDDRVEAAAVRHGYTVARARARPAATGSERCAEAVAAIPCRAVLDIQGDWPEVLPQDLEALVSQLLQRKAVCNTLCVPLRDAAIAANPNVVKVVRGRNGKALYFSRASIPYSKELAFPLLRHIGVYGFQRETLLRCPRCRAAASPRPRASSSCAFSRTTSRCTCSMPAATRGASRRAATTKASCSG
jgi:3-deoxy-manno-octulosonate cytidylyltransferase (CMP-KDO synthetase)